MRIHSDDVKGLKVLGQLVLGIGAVPGGAILLAAKLARPGEKVGTGTKVAAAAATLYFGYKGVEALGNIDRR